jgi:hypothetical protein
MPWTKSDAPAGRSRIKDLKQHGQDRYVVPHGNRWAAKKEKGSKEELFDTKGEALNAVKKED